MLIRKIMPPTWLLIAILIMLALHFFLPLAMIVPTVWNLLGLIPLLLGVSINFWADCAFHMVGTPVKPNLSPTTLVVYGAFQYTRNPMYLGFVLVLIGVAALLGSASPWAVIPLFALLLNNLYIPQEEKRIAEKFGTVWEGYKSSVRRWI
jgi:protein-S-isoprenylcysteine O-methyltransferase Ste14